MSIRAAQPPVVEPVAFAHALELLVNAHRRGVGLAALLRDPRLDVAARQHAQRMRNLVFFDHRDPYDGTAAPDRVAAAADGGTWSVIAENLAAGHRRADAVMHAWLTSEGHRANIEDPEVTHVGTAIETRGAYGTYATQVYGRPAPPGFDGRFRRDPVRVAHCPLWDVWSARHPLRSSTPRMRSLPTQ